jgi:hypothetical protein
MQSKKEVAVRLAVEASVVILSILAAFQLEEWRDDRAAVRLETAQLALIRADLLENQVRLENVIAMQNRVVTSGKNLLSIYSGESAAPSPDSVASLLDWAESWSRLEPVTGAYDAMVSSGDVTRLRNQELLRELAAFAGDLDAEFEDQDESMSLLAEMRRVVMDYGLDVLSRQRQGRIGLSGSASAQAVAAVLNNQRYAHLVALRTWMETIRLAYLEGLSDSMMRIRTLLEAELAMRGAA